MNHRVLLTKLYGMTDDAEFTKLIERMIVTDGSTSNSMGEKAYGAIRRMFSHPLYSNDQHVHSETRSFIYADDLCTATQRSTFEQTKTILTEALHNLGEYYEMNHLRANPDKTQTCAFHLKN